MTDSQQTVQFFFGPGSRYSYLAATQIPRLANMTGVQFVWRAIYSPDLIGQTGDDPFRTDGRRGQYHAAYRTRDAQRWAAYYGVPYTEPSWQDIDWRWLALACVAADALGAGEVFARCLFHQCFAEGKPPQRDEEVIAVAGLAGLRHEGFMGLARSPAIMDRHRRNLNIAVSAGAFGVPTFITDDGELFWGQDRIPLLLRHLSPQHGEGWPRG